MRVYWDSSALLNALCAQPVVDRLNQGEHVTRSHGFVESFSHLTGRGLPMKDGTRHKVTPADAARMLRALSRKLAVRDLTTEETLAVLEDANQRGVQGPQIHDLVHARAAKLAGAQLVLTRDEAFAGLCVADGLTTDWP